jgi:hypothetical protein
MRFVDLYNYANNGTSEPILLKDLVRRICMTDSCPVGEINFYAVNLDPAISYGHMIFERDRDSPYEGEFTVASIRLHRPLNRCWRRFVGCKEMMHIFDSLDERVDSREKFLRLLKEFESLPLKEDLSPMFSSELEAGWRALAILCPERLRAKYLAQWRDKSMTDYEAALALRVPEAVIKSLMSDYYVTALNTLRNKANGA